VIFLNKKKRAFLALEDGTIFKGYSFGADGEVAGEVVFNTSMTGYQEILTDPSYAGQIVTMTYPHIGNYGVNAEDAESRKIFLEGLIVRENSAISSNWRSTGTLENYLKEHGIFGIEGIDTRRLVRHIRSQGAMKGILSSIDTNEKSLIAKAKNSPSLVGRDLVKGVSQKASRSFGDKSGKYKVIAFDFGIKENIIRCLEKEDCYGQVVYCETTAEDILKENPDGIFLSNGPGDPAAVEYAIEMVKQLLGRKPVFGICLGHQILSLALGAQTYKLKFGHRGGNQPVKRLETGAVEITAQNHGFAVEDESMKKLNKKYPDLKISHINLNDMTVEGIESKSQKLFSVQYHPEASPGPHDSKYLFKKFTGLMEQEKEHKKSLEGLNAKKQ
jgi:carbamoyl-phosphate synthase small subunit